MTSALWKKKTIFSISSLLGVGIFTIFILLTSPSGKNQFTNPNSIHLQCVPIEMGFFDIRRVREISQIQQRPHKYGQSLIRRFFYGPDALFTAVPKIKLVPSFSGQTIISCMCLHKTHTAHNCSGLSSELALFGERP